MIILTIRTDKPKSEIGLYNGHIQLAYESWEAHRALAETIHQEIAKILQSTKKKLSDIEGIVIYKGPGSFTGLRIGLSVTNALAYSLQIPIVSESGTWIEQGINRLLDGDTENQALPDYGNPAHITTPKK